MQDLLEQVYTFLDEGKAQEWYKETSSKHRDKAKRTKGIRRGLHKMSARYWDFVANTKDPLREELEQLVLEAILSKKGRSRAKVGWSELKIAKMRKLFKGVQLASDKAAKDKILRKLYARKSS